MISVQKRDEFILFTIGPKSTRLTPPDARALGEFLSNDPASAVWANTDAKVVGAWRFEAARGVQHQHERDVQRQRVRVHCDAGRWHFLPEELVALGSQFRAVTP